MNDNKGKGGVGFVGVLLIIFITLKLCGVISWPWVWVLAPLWISFALYMAFLILFLFFAMAVVIAASFMKDE